MDLSQQTRAIVSVEDEALDRVKMNVERYARTRDPAQIVELPGQNATRYVVRRLTRREVEFVQSLPAPKMVSAFIQLGLVRVDHGGGRSVVPTRDVPSLTGHARTQKVWDDEPDGELDALHDEMTLSRWIEIANVIETMAGLPKGEACGSSDERFSLLPLSQSAMAQIVRRSVARTQG